MEKFELLNNFVEAITQTDSSLLDHKSDQLTDVLYCGICFQVMVLFIFVNFVLFLKDFSNNARPPLQLRCGHTFCGFCVNKISFETSVGFCLKINCAMCRITTRKIQEIKPNYMIKGILIFF